MITSHMTTEVITSSSYEVQESWRLAKWSLHIWQQESSPAPAMKFRKAEDLLNDDFTYDNRSHHQLQSMKFRKAEDLINNDFTYDNRSHHQLQLEVQESWGLAKWSLHIWQQKSSPAPAMKFRKAEDLLNDHFTYDNRSHHQLQLWSSGKLKTC